MLPEIWNDKIGTYSEAEFLDNLHQDEFYYHKDHGGLALSASNLKPYYKSIAAEQKTYGSTHALEFGNWCHKIILEPDLYSLEDCPEADRDHLQLLRDSVMANPTARSILDHKELRTEIPYVQKFDGIWVKGKIDIELPNEIWDLKTTSKLKSYDYTAKNVFGYPLSAWMYYILTGKVQHYIVVEKGSGDVKIVRSDLKFYKEGRRAFAWAWRNYKKSLEYKWTYLGPNIYGENFQKEIDNVHIKTTTEGVYAFIKQNQNEQN